MWKYLENCNKYIKNLRNNYLYLVEQKLYDINDVSEVMNSRK